MMDQTRLENGRALTEALIRELRSGKVLPETYPVLYANGVARGALHSYVLAGLLLLGDRMGYSAVFDSPIFEPLDCILTGEGAKRPDSIWFERGTETVRALIEFEHHSGNSLRDKAQNLILAARTCNAGLALVALIYWIADSQAQPNLEATCEVFKRGFSLGSSRFGPCVCPVLILETIATRQAGERLILSGFVARRFIFAGEDKPYVVEGLNAAHQ